MKQITPRKLRKALQSFVGGYHSDIIVEDWKVFPVQSGFGGHTKSQTGIQYRWHVSDYEDDILALLQDDEALQEFAWEIDESIEK